MIRNTTVATFVGDHHRLVVEVPIADAIVQVDQQSLSGTSDEGVSVCSAPLRHGSPIVVGTTRLRFDLIDTPPPDVDLPYKPARERAIRDFEHAYLVDLLAHQHGNVTAAARIAGIHRVHFYRLLWKHNLR